MDFPACDLCQPLSQFIDTVSPVNTQHYLNQGCIAWWRPLPNNDFAKYVYDIQGFNHGTVISLKWQGDPVMGSTLNFNGSTSVVNCGNSSILNPTTQMTGSVWFLEYPSTDQWGLLLARWNATTSYHFSANDGSFNKKPRIFLNTSGSGTVNVISSTAYTQQNWVHGVFTFDGSNLKLYQNGQNVGSTAATGTIVSTTETVFIGDKANPVTFPFFGLIAEVKMYNRALSATEVYALYLEGLANNPTTLNRLPLYGLQKSGQTLSGSATAQSVTTIQATGTIIRQASAAVAEEDILSPTATRIQVALTGVFPQDLLVPHGTRIQVAIATAQSVTTITATGTVIRQASAAIIGEDILSATGTRIQVVSATIQSVSTLTAAATVINQASAAIIGQDALSPIGTRIIVASCALVTVDTLTATGTRIQPASCALVIIDTVTATGSSINPIIPQGNIWLLMSRSTLWQESRRDTNWTQQTRGNTWRVVSR